MLRARAPVGQGLGGPWLLDGHEAFPLQALEHRERRRQQFTLLAVVPTPTCDRRLDGGDQELGRRPSVTRFHRRAADPGSRSFRSRRSHPRQQGPQQPTRSGRSLFPATPMISGAAIAVGYRLRREVDPSESRLTATHARSLPQSSHLPRYPTPQPAGRRALQACHRCCASAASENRGRSTRMARRRPSSRSPLQAASRPDDTSESHRQGRQGRFGISGIELCDDHHTLPPFFFIALPTHDVAPDKIKRPPQGRLSECYTGYSSSSPRSRLLPGQPFSEMRNHGRWRAATG